MNDLKGVIARDLGRDLQNRIGEVIQRQGTIAAAVLQPGELAVILVELAVSVTITVAATVAVNSNKPDEAFDTVLALIAKNATGERARSLSEVAAKRDAMASAR